MSLFNFLAAADKPERQDPTSFVRPLAEPVQVTRSKGNCLHLQWQEPANRITVHVGTNPDDFDQMSSILSVSDGQEAMVAGLNTAVRHYFRLTFQGGPWDGRSLLAAERQLPLQKGVNLRDAGGYYTRDGQQVRWGKLYRSGSLSRLTQADQAYLQRLNLRLVCDLRSMTERTTRPDKLPNSPDLVEQPLPMESLDRWERLRGAYYIFFRRGQIDAFMQDGYRRVFIDRNPQVFGEIFRRLADPEQLPAVIHCTAGKDRTGLASAMLLLVLGVPEETVVADYTMSNLFYADFQGDLARDLQQVTPWGISLDDLQDFLLVKEKTLLGTLDHLRQKYGSLVNYLQTAAGVSDETLHQLRQNWLMPVA